LVGAAVLRFEFDPLDVAVLDRVDRALDEVLLLVVRLLLVGHDLADGQNAAAARGRAHEPPPFLGVVEPIGNELRHTV
jgi:hypothetical protein